MAGVRRMSSDGRDADARIKAYVERVVPGLVGYGIFFDCSHDTSPTGGIGSGVIGSLLFSSIGPPSILLLPIYAYLRPNKP